MAKESLAGQECACGMRIYFMQQHVPHCKHAQAAIAAGRMRLTTKDEK